MTLSEFYTELGYHDWYYEYSDDHGVWRRGREDYGRLVSIAKESPEHQKLFEDYSAYVFTGTPKPEVPA